MSDHLKSFYTLEEVKKILTESKDPKLCSDLTIKRFIDTHLLTPYVHYKGIVNSVKSVYSKSREDAIKQLSATINENISDLELKYLIDPQRYDASLDVDAIIYQAKKLLATFKDKYAMGYDSLDHYVEGIFSISPNNIKLTKLGLKVKITEYEPISHHIKFLQNSPLKNQDFVPLVREDEVFGWILHMPDSDHRSKLKLEKQCKLIFSSQDFNYLLHRIENINLAPKLANDLKEANILISQQNTQIEDLKEKLNSKKSTDELHPRTANNAGKIISALASEISDLDITQPYSKDGNRVIKEAIERQGNDLSADVIANWLKIAHEQSK